MIYQLFFFKIATTKKAATEEHSGTAYYPKIRVIFTKRSRKLLASAGVCQLTQINP